jgi:transketolase
MSSLVRELQKKAYQIRHNVLEMCVTAGTGHVTSCLSCIDVLVALHYGGIMRLNPSEPKWSERDRFILSKGQASPALYAILADMGFFPAEELSKFAQKGGAFGVHLQQNVPGVEITSGSLGQGFGLAAGLALGARMNREQHLVFTMLGDGECYEGSIWETAMFAGHNRLNNMVAVLDRNYLCVTDFTENLVALEPFADKWLAFGWDVLRVDGHDFSALLEAFSGVRARRSDKPLIIIADTVKGEGVESIANIPLWHGAAPAGEFADICRADLERRYGNE